MFIPDNVVSIVCLYQTEFYQYSGNENVNRPIHWKYQFVLCEINSVNYGECPKISHTKVFDKIAYANSTNPDQTACLIRVYTVCHSYKLFKK